MDRTALRLGRTAALGVTLALLGAAVTWVATGAEVLASEASPRRAVTEVAGATAARQPRAARPARAAAPRPAPDPGGVWAVMVGADDYPGTGYDLLAGVADARDVDAMLEQRGVPSSRRRLLLEGEANAANVRRALRWLARHAGPDATAVFFFSGHVRQKAGDPDGDGEHVDESMVFPDGSQIFDGELASLMEPLRAARTWVGMAACYGAGMDDVMAVVDGVLTAASPEDELAYENDRFNRTYLVEYMVRQGLLEGAAGDVSLQAAFRWADARIAHDYPSRRPVIVDTLGTPLRLG